MSHPEQIKKCVPLHRDSTADSGELTPPLNPRRGVIAENMRVCDSARDGEKEADTDMPTPVIVATARSSVDRAFNGSLTGQCLADTLAMMIRNTLEQVPALEPDTAEVVEFLGGAAL
jgi:hypothetical protein